MACAHLHDGRCATKDRSEAMQLAGWRTGGGRGLTADPPNFVMQLDDAGQPTFIDGGPGHLQFDFQRAGSACQGQQLSAAILKSRSPMRRLNVIDFDRLARPRKRRAQGADALRAVAGQADAFRTPGGG
jgi:hypothetical protein